MVFFFSLNSILVGHILKLFPIYGLPKLNKKIEKIINQVKLNFAPP